MAEFDWKAYATSTAQRIGLDPAWLIALIRGESSGRQTARSSAGAIGYTQLMPATAASLGVDPRDPKQNIEGGARYLKQQLDRFGTYPLALAAYNAGPGAVDKYGGIPPYTETQNYVQRVTKYATQARTTSSTGGSYGPKQGANRDEAEAIMRRHGLTVSSNDRDPARNAAVGGATNSMHLTTRTDVWAIDGVGTETAMQSAKTEIAREVDDVLELMIHDAGSGRHLHVGGKAGGSGNAARATSDAAAGGASDAASSTTMVGLKQDLANFGERLGENFVFVTILGSGLLLAGGLFVLGAFGATGRGAKVGPFAIGGAPR